MSPVRVGAPLRSGAGDAVLSGKGGGPANGAIKTSERNTSGRASAHQAATEAPKSWPTTAAAEAWPSAATSPSMSRARLSMRNEARSPS